MNLEKTTKLKYHIQYLETRHSDKRYLINSISIHLNEILILFIESKNKIPKKLKDISNKVNCLPLTSVFNNSNNNCHNEEKALSYCSEALKIIYTMINKNKYYRHK